jgi:hypothetical protein
MKDEVSSAADPLLEFYLSLLVDKKEQEIFKMLYEGKTTEQIIEDYIGFNDKKKNEK